MTVRLKPLSAANAIRALGEAMELLSMAELKAADQERGLILWRSVVAGEADSEECIHGLAPGTCSICSGREAEERRQGADLRVSRCRSCDAEIIWAKTSPRGASMPLDAEPVIAGKFVVIRTDRDDNGRTVPVVQAVHADEDWGDRSLYLSHFSTCPNADQHRRN